jgi:hypothetical protein
MHLQGTLRSANWRAVVREDGLPEVKQEEPRQATIFINGVPYRVDDRPVTGADLRQVPTPPISSDFDLIEEKVEGEDVIVHEDEVVQLADGRRFFVVPRRILAGRN